MFAGLFAAIKLWSIWGRLGAWLSSAWNWATKNPVAALLALSLVGNAVLFRLWRWADSDLAQANQTIALIKAAQKEATTSQIIVNQAPAVSSAAIARQSDDEAPAFYGSVASAAAAHDSIVRSTCAASPPSAASVPGPDPVAPIDDGPGAAAIMVSRPKADDDLIVAAAGRAAQMHADAESLIAAGVAVPDDTAAP